MAQIHILKVHLILQRTENGTAFDMIHIKVIRLDYKIVNNIGALGSEGVLTYIIGTSHRTIDSLPNPLLRQFLEQVRMNLGTEKVIRNLKYLHLPLIDLLDLPVIDNGLVAAHGQTIRTRTPAPYLVQTGKKAPTN